MRATRHRRSNPASALLAAAVATMSALMLIAAADPPANPPPAANPAPAAPAAPPANPAPPAPPIPTTPAPITKLLVARPFQVTTGWASDWRADHAEVEEGWLVVLEASDALLLQRQVASPILFAGATTVERVNHGFRSGKLIAIVPATPRAAAAPGPDPASHEGLRSLSETAIWFGNPGLPEQVDNAIIHKEVDLARAAMIAPRAQAELDAALASGGAALQVADKAALLEAAKALVHTWSPDEE